MDLRLPFRFRFQMRCVAGLGFLVAVCCGARVGDTAKAAKANASRKVAALSPWEQAERGRDALEATANEARTKADYARAMDAYRVIYHANPGDVHAAAAANAVAEMLAEQGRGMRDAKASKAAIAQYEFLRTQYPGSSLRVQALLAEGQIAQNDLGDKALAAEKYALLVKTHPRSEEAEEARAGIESLQQGSGTRDQGSGIRDQAGCDWAGRPHSSR